MAKRNLVHPHVAFYNDVVTTPLLVCAADPQRVFIRLPDRIQLGTLGQSATMELPLDTCDEEAITNKFKVVTTVRAEFELDHLRQLASAKQVQLPPEILLSVKELLRGKRLTRLTRTVPRRVVLIWRTWGSSDPSCGAVLDTHKVPWALSVSKPTIFHGWLDHETFNARDGKIAWGAWLRPRAANIMYLRGPEATLAMPSERKVEFVAEAFHKLWISKLPGQSKPARELFFLARPKPSQSRHAKRLLAHIKLLNEMYWCVATATNSVDGVKDEHCRSLQEFAGEMDTSDASAWHNAKWCKSRERHLFSIARESYASRLDESAENAAPIATRSKL